jgi:hypothetical protein
MRLYSLRGSAGDYTAVDFDLETKQATYVEVVLGCRSRRQNDPHVGDTFTYTGPGNPWDSDNDNIEIVDTDSGQVIGNLGIFGPMWERVAEGEQPSQAYGPDRNPTTFMFSATDGTDGTWLETNGITVL